MISSEILLKRLIKSTKLLFTTKESLSNLTFMEPLSSKSNRLRKTNTNLEKCNLKNVSEKQICQNKIRYFPKECSLMVLMVPGTITNILKLRGSTSASAS